MNFESATPYYGFEVPRAQMEASDEDDYYAKAKREILRVSLTKAEEIEFSYPHDQWGAYRNLHRAEFRKNYFNSLVLTPDLLKTNAASSIQLTKANGDKIDVILSALEMNQYETDAVVNAANETLLGGGGVDFQIHQGAGPLLVRECALLNGCGVGEAVLTKGYNLPANYVIHTVGPLLDDDGTPDAPALKSCYESCLSICESNNFTSVAIPCIACGFYAFPIDQAAAIAMKTIADRIQRFPNNLKTIVICADEKKQSAYINEFKKYAN